MPSLKTPILWTRQAAALWFAGLLRINARMDRRRCDVLVVFDLDNTLADTAASFELRDASDFARLAGLEPKPDMVELLALAQQRWPVLVVSARANRFYPQTLSWVMRHTAIGDPRRVIQVPSPEQKIAALAPLVRQFRKVVLIDDMTGQHETGTPTLYTDAIAAARRAGIVHIGRDFIDSSQSVANKLNTLEEACL